MSLIPSGNPSLRRKLAYGLVPLALFSVLVLGVMAGNGWLPHTDAMTGKKTGWFGSELPMNASSVWNPFAEPLPLPTPQLSKELIYAGSRLVAVEDANASAASITGNIDYAIISKPVSDVSLDATGSPPVSGTSDGSGNYSLAGFSNGAYSVTPTRLPQECKTANGVSSFDAGLVAQHVVFLITLSADQQIAGDVSELGQLSSFDAGLIAQKVVGICDTGVAGHWKFGPASVSHTSVTANLTENYKAYLMGDVSGDWDPEGSQRPVELESTTSAVRARISNVQSSPGSTVIVPLTMENLNGAGVTSFQFDIEYNPAVTAPANVAADLVGTLGNRLKVVWNVPEPGLLKVVVYGAYPVTTDGVFVKLRFRAIGGIGTTSPLNIRGFQFNRGDTPTTTVNGQFGVVATSNPN